MSIKVFTIEGLILKPAPRARGTKKGHFYNSAAYNQYRDCLGGLIVLQNDLKEPLQHVDWAIVRYRGAKINPNADGVDNLAKPVFDTLKDYSVISGDALKNVPNSTKIYRPDLRSGLDIALVWDEDLDQILSKIKEWTSL
jgi:Holliday junction resolvase RusA-like endonuclease